MERLVQESVLKREKPNLSRLLKIALFLNFPSLARFLCQIVLLFRRRTFGAVAGAAFAII